MANMVPLGIHIFSKEGSCGPSYAKMLDTVFDIARANNYKIYLCSPSCYLKMALATCVDAAFL